MGTLCGKTCYQCICIIKSPAPSIHFTQYAVVLVRVLAVLSASRGPDGTVFMVSNELHLHENTPHSHTHTRVAVNAAETTTLS